MYLIFHYYISNRPKRMWQQIILKKKKNLLKTPLIWDVCTKITSFACITVLHYVSVCVICHPCLLYSLCNPLAQLTAGGLWVGREDDQATLGVVHVSGVLAAALSTLRQWIPGHPRCAETFLQWRPRTDYFLHNQRVSAHNSERRNSLHLLI